VSGVSRCGNEEKGLGRGRGIYNRGGIENWTLSMK
jgi:hypothetical protein